MFIKKTIFTAIIAIVIVISGCKEQNRITLHPDSAGKKIDVLYDGKIFTS